MRHTPGPWIVTDDPCIHVRSPDHGCVLAYDYVTDANANLIAAAPDMQEALDLVIGSIKCDRQDDVNNEVLRRVGKALAKARGES